MSPHRLLCQGAQGQGVTATRSPNRRTWRLIWRCQKPDAIHSKFNGHVRLDAVARATCLAARGALRRAQSGIWSDGAGRETNLITHIWRTKTYQIQRTCALTYTRARKPTAALGNTKTDAACLCTIAQRAQGPGSIESASSLGGRAPTPPIRHRSRASLRTRAHARTRARAHARTRARAHARVSVIIM